MSTMNGACEFGTAGTPTVAVVIPCYNEEQTIGPVIVSLRKAFSGEPYGVKFYVCDNASTDNTGQAALAAGAELYFERHRGKGNAVRRLFMEVDADVYLMTDGDCTYESTVAPPMVRRVWQLRQDMVTGIRRHTDNAAYRRGHQVGNRAMTWAVNCVFGQSTEDVFSGYRAFSKRFVKSFPASSSGFEIETELTAHACEMRAAISEMDCAYYPRPTGSHSKLSTYGDGIRIARKIVDLFRLHRPFAFYGSIAALLALGGLAVGARPVVEFIDTGKVPHFPSAILASGIMVLSCISLTCGLILDNLSRFRIDIKRIMLLQIASKPK